MKRLSSGLLGVCAALFGVNPADAVTVEFEFWGSVQSVLDTHGVLPGSIGDGTQVRGHVRYDSALPDVFAAMPDAGLYFQAIPPGDFLIVLGGLYDIAPASPLQLIVLDDFMLVGGTTLSDSFGWHFDGGTFPIPGAPSASFTTVTFDMDTSDTSMFASDALPDAALDGEDFDVRKFGITGCLNAELDGHFCEPSETIQIFGAINGVPEPAHGAGAGAALATLHRLARRLRRA